MLLPVRSITPSARDYLYWGALSVMPVTVRSQRGSTLILFSQSDLANAGRQCAGAPSQEIARESCSGGVAKSAIQMCRKKPRGRCSRCERHHSRVPNFRAHSSIANHSKPIRARAIRVRAIRARAIQGQSDPGAGGARQAARAAPPGTPGGCAADAGRRRGRKREG
jgi:hypothetical protein